MANVMGLKSLQNKVHRNGFDLSRKNAFTAKVGELLPIVTLECLPGDKFTIRNQWFSRTMPVNSAAFTRLREYYDVYFVPYTVLWNRFDDFIAQTNNSNHASAINSSDALASVHPYFSVNDVLDFLYTMKTSHDYANNIFGFQRWQLSCKLLDYLGYGDFTEVTKNASDIPYVGDDSNLNLNAFPLLAYQKIYNDYYRDQQWESSQPQCFNVDYLHGSSTSSMIVPIGAIPLSEQCMFDLRYASWNKDYFMGLLPSAQFGETAVATPLQGCSYVNLGDDSGDFDDGSFNPQKSSNAIEFTGNMNSVEPAGISVLALRQAEFLQKWREIAQSGKQDYKDQMKKHFGVDVPEGMSHLCQYVGGWSNDLNINEVVNQNLVGDGSDAQIFGKGIGNGDGKVDYTCKEHGILMVMYHATPLLDYANTGIKKFNQKVFATDYAIPEFDQLGMQAVNLSEFAFLGNAKMSNPLLPDILNHPNMPMGYAPRYAEYKTAYDEVHGAFVDTLSYWVAPIDMLHIVAYLSSLGESPSSFTTWPWLKVNPTVLDSIFVQAATADINTDQLLCNSFFDIKSVRNLDYNGLPY